MLLKNFIIAMIQAVNSVISLVTLNGWLGPTPFEYSVGIFKLNIEYSIAPACGCIRGRCSEAETGHFKNLKDMIVSQTEGGRFRPLSGFRCETIESRQAQTRSGSM
jgi:hypothetical protein